MSTRCQIRFEEEWEWDGKTHRQIAQIYRHSDGYPDGSCGVVSDLKKFFEWYGSEPNARTGDVSYACADFIYFMKNDMDDDLKKEGWNKLGYGVENPSNGIHGDEEYLYVVTYKDGKWYVKVSDIFPREDEFLNTAFENADWEFEGTLEEAYQKYVVETTEDD